MRRILSHAFSDRAMKEQEPLLKTWSGTLVHKLRELSTKEPGKSVDMVKFWNLTTFEIMSDLVHPSGPAASA